MDIHQSFGTEQDSIYSDEKENYGYGQTNGSTQTTILRRAQKDNELPKRPIHDSDSNHVFSEFVIKERLSAAHFEKYRQASRQACMLNLVTANAIATAMSSWAIEKGATHYCHWFHPLTEKTAEKHDTLQAFDANGNCLSKFRGEDLIQGEPDASSFPSGGLRATHEARGYTIWDPSSPAFISDVGGTRTLCIPSVFVSWTCEALDFKTPLLRSIDAINTQSMRVLRLFDADSEVDYVESVIGPEQEYFLVDAELYEQRPDLMATGRTLLGMNGPRDQQLSQNYFGDMPARVRCFIDEVETELRQLGIPVQTRHNEVAPNQFEFAPICEEVNLACDHQALVMSTIQNVAVKHGLRVLLHEKPFAGINGSGKHNNWSLQTSTGRNLLDPGDSTEENLQFLLFVVAVISAVNRHQELLRTSVASIGNDLRMGGHEAPPAIMSIFLGDALSQAIAQLEAGEPIEIPAKGILTTDIDRLPVITKHPGDRNRTSPFAFVGNRFEFRAVGSNSPSAWSNTVLNTIVADSLENLMDQLESQTANAKTNESKTSTIARVLGEIVRRHKRILFEADGYSEAWQKEAKKRGLSNLIDTVESLPSLQKESVKSVFLAQGVLSESELKSRQNVQAERFIFQLSIEAETLLSMTRQQVLPAARQYESEFADGLLKLNKLNSNNKSRSQNLEVISRSIDDLDVAVQSLAASLRIDWNGDLLTTAKMAARKIQPSMKIVRECADELETLLPLDVWPLPSYSELLNPIC